MASSGTAVCIVPADYDELARLYEGEIKSMVWTQLGPLAQAQDVDDGVQYILMRFIANDVIDRFDPGYVSDFTGQPVKFRAFIKAQVALYCRGLRESLGKRAGRDLLVLDASQDDDAPSVADGAAATTDTYPSLEDGEALQRLRGALAHRRPAAGSQPVLPLFDALARQYSEGKTVSVGAVRGQFGMTKAEGDAWMTELQAALTEASSPRRYDLGGIPLSASQVRAAVNALRETPGNRVLPAFQAAGHPLKDAGKTWYLEFAAGVGARYPETRVKKGGHYPGGHFGRVKAALIYGMEKMLGDETAPMAPPPAEGRAWAELRRALDRVPGDGEDKLAAFEAVRLILANA